MDNFNQLTHGQAERLAILLEELGEAQQAIGKILRHGYDSTHPDGGPNNREQLERELGDVQYAICMLCVNKELDEQHIIQAKNDKTLKIQQYLHHDK